MSIKYEKGYKYKTVKQYNVKTNIRPLNNIEHSFIKLTTDGCLTIENAYAFDGPSGPSIDTKTFMRASLVHDALYQLIRDGMLSKSYRKACDKELRTICKQDGMCSFRAWYVYHAVRIFGDTAIKPREIYTAP